MKTILGYDLGGSSLRAGLIDVQGQLLDSAKVDLAVTFPNPDRAEADPGDWWRKLVQVTHAVLGRPPGSQARIEALVIGAMTRTQVLVDASGQPLRPAITWADGRATREASEIQSLLNAVETAETLAGPVNAFHPLARVVWLRRNEPDIYKKTRYVLEPKDFLNLRLTGLAAADRISQARNLSVSGQPAHLLMTRIGLEPNLFPPLADPADLLGEIRAGLEEPFDQLAGIPVFVGGMDAWCASVGMGCHFEGCGLNVSGTSEVFGVIGSAFQAADGLTTVPWGDGYYHIGGPSQVGGDCLVWFAQTFGKEQLRSETPDLLRQLAEGRRHPEPIIFLPYLRGERTPLWDPQARGLFFGIHRDHRRLDFLWALVEGVAMANRQILERAAQNTPLRTREVRIGGGASGSDLWCQVKADVLNLPMIRTTVAEAGLLGAGIVGWHGLGAYPTLSQAEAAMIRIERTFEPDCGPWGKRSHLYDLLYERFLEIQAQALPLYHSLAEAEQNGLLFDP
ncbi:MAG: hypothetical protein JSW39_00545 [Desulfobacterales bacterium]|nr:MAG: hypothetical protein JSW39_00545 [Desulfobacterales bacterium]